MKKSLICGLLLAMVVSATAAELKIATVDLDKVFSAHPRTVLAETELKKAEEGIEAEMDKMRAEGRALQEDIARLREAAKSALLTEEARLKNRDDAEEKLTELQEFEIRARRTQETRVKQMREQVLKSRQSIVDELLELVNRFGKSAGYDLILDRSGMTMNAIPLVLYADPKTDVTERIIAYLKSKDEKK